MRVSWTTVVLGGAAMASTAVVQIDPGGGAGPDVAWVSTRSAARKLLPRVSGPEESIDAVTLAPAGERRVRIVTRDDRPQVWVDDELLGPADAEAVDGLLASLRMATTLRAVSDDAEAGVAWRGSILVEAGQTTSEIRVGGDTADGAGVYGLLPQEGEQVWVIEHEVALLLAQEPKAWLLSRLSSISASDVVALRWNDRALARGEDDIWRETDKASPALLANDAIDARIERLFGATFEPVAGLAAFDRSDLQPWLRVRTRSEEPTIRVGGVCPGREDARVVDRGPGALGCVSADLLRPWPVGEDVEPRLLPHAYARVLGIAQERPQPRGLRRAGQGWVLVEEDDVVDVAEPEVYRYYAALHEARVERASEAEEAWRPELEIVVVTDSTRDLRLACDAGASLCRRDRGPLLRVTEPAAIEIGFSRDTFAERRLVDLAPGEARAIEILPGDEGTRQSVRLDLGVWTKDAPEGGDLDTERVDALLSAVMSARAKDWVGVPQDDPLRTLRIERAPRQGQGTLVVALYAGCVAKVEGRTRAAVVFPETCEALSADLVSSAQ